MNLIQRFVIISLLLILSGCGFKSGRHNPLPAVPDREMAGKIVVVRIRSFFAVLQGWEVLIDGKSIFGIGSGEYTEVLLPEGSHCITLRCYQPGFSPLPVEIPYEDSLSFALEASQTLYFLASPSLKCGKIRLSNEAEAKKYIEQSTFINLEN